MAGGLQICSKCGQAFDGDKCWTCVARIVDVEETMKLSLAVATGGYIGEMLATNVYPPLIGRADPWVAGLAAFLFFTPLATWIVVHGFRRVERYATLLKLMLILSAAALVMTAALFFLNGALDSNAPVETDALVSGARAEALAMSVSWNNRQIKQEVTVNDPDSLVEPGDVVRLHVHAGEFSVPWFDHIRVSNCDGTTVLTSR